MATVKKTAAPRKAAAKKATGAPVKKPAAAPKPAARKQPAKAPAGKTVKAPPVKAAKPVKVEKVRKPKLVRDSFTIPKAEYVVLDDLKLRSARLTRPAKKSELLRAGIKVLAALSDAAFLTALEQVPAIKTGRPAAGK